MPFRFLHLSRSSSRQTFTFDECIIETESWKVAFLALLRGKVCQQLDIDDLLSSSNSLFEREFADLAPLLQSKMNCHEYQTESWSSLISAASENRKTLTPSLPLSEIQARLASKETTDSLPYSTIAQAILWRLEQWSEEEIKPAIEEVLQIYNEINEPYMSLIPLVQLRRVTVD